MPYAQNGLCRLYYEDWGQGTPVVLLMGLGGSSSSWLFHANRLKKEFRVICPDNRGVGNSDKPDEPYSMEMFSEDLLAIFDQCGIDKAILVGLSMGGLIAQEFYSQHPERVRALVLCSTGVGPNDPAFIHPAPRVNDILANHKRNSDEQSDEQQDYSDFISIFYHPDYLKKMPDLPEIIRQYMAQDQQPSYAYHRQLAACYTHACNSCRLKNIQVPMRMIHGHDDQLFPIANTEYLLNNVPGSDAVIIPNSGHMLFIEQAENFHQALYEFLQKYA